MITTASSEPLVLLSGCFSSSGCHPSCSTMSSEERLSLLLLSFALLSTSEAVGVALFAWSDVLSATAISVGLSIWTGLFSSPSIGVSKCNCNPPSWALGSLSRGAWYLKRRLCSAAHRKATTQLSASTAVGTAQRYSRDWTEDTLT